MIFKINDIVYCKKLQPTVLQYTIGIIINVDSKIENRIHTVLFNGYMYACKPKELGLVEF